jgi:hypothetical protein
VAVGAGGKLRDGAESGIGRRGIRERRKAAVAYGLVAVPLSVIRLIYRPSAPVMGPQIDHVSDAMFQTEAPLHEVGSMEDQLFESPVLVW